MSQYGSYGARRSEMRKKKKQNTVINGAIILAVIGIVFFAGTLIFGGNNSEPAAGDELEEEQNENEKELLEEEEEDLAEPDSTVDSSDETNEETTESDSNESSEEEVDTETSENESPGTVIGEGQWQPIGTVQEEPFVAVYEKEHVNWGEMERAFMYATGLNEESMINWFTSNGGDHLSAVGIISDYANSDTPYEVRIEWVTNEGWMPVYVKQLDHNPRR